MSKLKNPYATFNLTLKEKLIYNEAYCIIICTYMYFNYHIATVNNKFA